jgi:hypothetical protein
MDSFEFLNSLEDLTPSAYKWYAVFGENLAIGIQVMGMMNDIS